MNIRFIIINPRTRAFNPIKGPFPYVTKPPEQWSKRQVTRLGFGSVHTIWGDTPQSRKSLNNPDLSWKSSWHRSHEMDREPIRLTQSTRGGGREGLHPDNQLSIYLSDIKWYFGAEMLTKMADICNSSLVHIRNQYPRFARSARIEDITGFWTWWYGWFQSRYQRMG